MTTDVIKPKTVRNMAEDLHLQLSQAPQSNEPGLHDVSKKLSQVSVVKPSEADATEDRVKPSLPSLPSLPDDVIANIISFLPPVSDHLFDRDLRVACSNLSLAYLNPRHACLYANSFKHVWGITHPSFLFSTLPTRTRSARHLRKSFLSFLIRQCPNIVILSAPCVSGVLQYLTKRIEEIAFVDTGLTDADHRFLSTAGLRCVTVTNPSASLLVALSQVRTLKVVELRQVHESLDLTDFLACTTATKICLSFDSPFVEHQVLAVFQSVTRFESFIFSCTRHHLWTLPYLRTLAVTVREVTMLIEGFKIFVRPPNPDDISSTAWDDQVKSQLMFRKGLEFFASHRWPRDVYLLRLDIFHMLNALSQGVNDFCLTRLFDEYFSRDDIDLTFVELHLNYFTTNIPLLCRAWDIIREFRAENIRTLKISYIYILFAGQRKDVGAYKSISCLISDFENLTTIQICAESKDSTPFRLDRASLLSPRFIMSLVSFLRLATRRKRCKLRTVLMEEAGELALQRTGVSGVSDEKMVKRLIHSVVAWVKKLEEEKNIELGTIVEQLQYWASRKLRKVHRSELDDVRVIRHLPLQRCDGFEFISDSGNCELV